MSPHKEVIGVPTRTDSPPALPEDKDNPFAQLPDEIYTLILQKDASFLSKHFITVTENLIKNPNITSSCVFRADIFFDSATQAPMLDRQARESQNGTHETFEHATRHLQEEYRP